MISGAADGGASPRSRVVASGSWSAGSPVPGVPVPRALGSSSSIVMAAGYPFSPASSPEAEFGERKPGRIASRWPARAWNATLCRRRSFIVHTVPTLPSALLVEEDPVIREHAEHPRHLHPDRPFASRSSRTVASAWYRLASTSGPGRGMTQRHSAGDGEAGEAETHDAELLFGKGGLPVPRRVTAGGGAPAGWVSGRRLRAAAATLR